MGTPHRQHAKTRRLTIRAALLALLASCAACSVSEAECRGMNWYQLGYSDGWGGHPQQIMRLTGLCARHGVRAAQADYVEGWAIGHDARERLKTMRDD
jgi:hypothetical protein